MLTTAFSTLDSHENIMSGEESQINHFYIQKNKDAIIFKFIGNEEFLQEMNNRPVNVLIPLDEYLRKKRITSEESINKEKKLFFDFYGK